MKSWNGPLLAAALGAAIACATVGCGTTSTTASTPQQTAINTAYTSYQALDQSILATDAAVKSGALKKADAQKALAGFTLAKTGLDAGLAALKAAQGASGVSP